MPAGSTLCSHNGGHHGVSFLARTKRYIEKKLTSSATLYCDQSVTTIFTIFRK